MGTVGGEELQRLGGHEEKIVVSVRVRPLNEKEIAKYDVLDWECVSNDTIVYKNNLPIPERSMYPSAYTFGTIMSDSLIRFLSTYFHSILSHISCETSSIVLSYTLWISFSFYCHLLAL